MKTGINFFGLLFCFHSLTALAAPVKINKTKAAISSSRLTAAGNLKNSAAISHLKVWKKSTLVTGNSAPYCCGMAVSSAQKLDISYYDSAQGGMVSANYNAISSNPLTQSVADNSLSFGTSSALANKNSKVYIIYSDNSTDTLKYATNKSGSWDVETVYQSPDDSTHRNVNGADAISIDGDGFAHVVYTRSVDGDSDIYYATNQSGSWESELVNSSNAIEASLALDSAGVPHIVFTDSEGLESADKTAEGWRTETIDDTIDFSTSFGAPGMAIDASDHIHVSYNSSNVILKYATNKSGDWKTEIVQNEGVRIYNSSLVVDSSKQPHISYNSLSSRQYLTYAYKQLGQWHNIVLDYSDASEKTIIAKDSADNLYIVYTYDDEIKLATTAKDATSLIKVGTDTLNVGTSSVRVEASTAQTNTSTSPQNTTRDNDSDGTLDVLDNDDDNDGVPDNVDPDDDGDGVLDISDPDYIDTDHDGVVDSIDPDDDNDGILDVSDPDLIDSDGDGIVDSEDSYDNSYHHGI